VAAGLREINPPPRVQDAAALHPGLPFFIWLRTLAVRDPIDELAEEFLARCGFPCLLGTVAAGIVRIHV
jgi:hypothetical protein